MLLAHDLLILRVRTVVPGTVSRCHFHVFGQNCDFLKERTNNYQFFAILPRHNEGNAGPIF